MQVTVTRSFARDSGGGIRHEGAGRVALVASTVKGNATAGDGGGIASASTSSLSVTRTTFSGNAAAGDGGGIQSRGSGPLVLLDSTLAGNTGRNGGGLTNAAGATLRISRSTLRDNRARQAGGGLLNASGAPAEIENSTLSGNSAQSGGGIASDAGAGLRVVNATLFGNSAPSGGGISHAAPRSSTLLVLRNTIVAGSPAGGSCAGLVASEGGNLDSGDTCTFRSARDRRNVDPGLEPLAANGGFTSTHALTPSSPGVNGGVSLCPPTDQRGVARPQNDGCDIGAYELESVPAPPRDQTPPNTTITEALTSQDRATFRFTGSDDRTAPSALLFECRLDRRDWAPCTSPQSYTDLSRGRHTFDVRATDEAGNVDPTPASRMWAASVGNCREATVAASAEADAWIDEASPTVNKGSDAILNVESSVNGSSRALVRVVLPREAPPGCVVESAKLRLFTDSADEGTRFDVVRLASGWSESLVTWSNQPATIGAAATAWATEGYMQWNVTSQVEAMFGGANHGFLIRSSAEGTDAAGEAGYFSREKAEKPPELVIRFAAPPTGEPPGAPAPPAPAAVSCGQVLTASTLVTNDLSECPGDGLVIGAPRVIVDLGGHTIDGVGLGTGIYNDGYESVTVRNGTVQEFDYGVRLFAETERAVVERLTLRLNQLAGIELFHAPDNVVRANKLDGNGAGIALVNGTIHTLVADNAMTRTAGESLLVRDSNANRLERNSVNGGGDLGIGLQRASGNTLLGNTVAGNSDRGIGLERASGNTLLRNTVSGNSDGGIELTAGSNDNRVEGNTVAESGDTGIWVVESDRNELISNTAHLMSDSGISLESANDGVVRDNDLRFNSGGLQMDGSSRNLIARNNASETTGYGIELGGGSFDNHVVENTAFANGAAGIYVADEALTDPGNRLDRNTASRNLAGGIVLAKGGHTVTANVARDNRGWGINAALGTVDGGGNVASGNGEAAQCIGIDCGRPAPPDGDR